MAVSLAGLLILNRFCKIRMSFIITFLDVSTHFLEYQHLDIYVSAQRVDIAEVETAVADTDTDDEDACIEAALSGGNSADNKDDGKIQSLLMMIPGNKMKKKEKTKPGVEMVEDVELETVVKRDLSEHKECRDLVDKDTAPADLVLHTKNDTYHDHHNVTNISL